MDYLSNYDINIYRTLFKIQYNIIIQHLPDANQALKDRSLEHIRE